MSFRKFSVLYVASNVLSEGVSMYLEIHISLRTCNLLDELVTTRMFLEDMNFLHRIANVTLTCTTRTSD